ncbi:MULTISPECIES: DUF742 domain-containing protein [Streptomycetaceae]|uniref:DUF742 domain-containing protein n=1 Tax=Streptomycetaceae TaxID=2062 RepID=UPI000998B096|nr:MULTISPECIES: DUF742 domain-containing protein [Streptomycetaceae]MDX2851893.1 DUF742 domain-containing protein [Streptomyces sp. PA03-3a]MYX36289.1 DUF742 domain-containing protein [Streptomyces sp. SID8377]
MATPPGGDQYGNHQQQPPLKRFNFPSAPSQDPPPSHGGENPGPGPMPPHRQPRIQPYEPPQAPPPRTAQTGRARTPSGLVRPYAMTGGRTRPRYQLAIEALVSTTADPAQLRGQLPEHQRICILCREIKSVAEISALLSIPLGVARILVADLAEAGLVAIHQPGGDDASGGQPDVTLLERVLSGLRKL